MVGAFCEVAFHRGPGALRQRGDALSSYFAGAGDVCSRTEVDVVKRQRTDLTDTKSGLDGVG